MTRTPHITVEWDSDIDQFRLMAENYGSKTVCGAAILRGNPPAIKFRYDSAFEAQAEAKLLQEYLDAVWPKKISKGKQRAAHD